MYTGNIIIKVHIYFLNPRLIYLLFQWVDIELNTNTSKYNFVVISVLGFFLPRIRSTNWKVCPRKKAPHFQWGRQKRSTRRLLYITTQTRWTLRNTASSGRLCRRRLLRFSPDDTNAWRDRWYSPSYEQKGLVHQLVPWSNDCSTVCRICQCPPYKWYPY